MKKRERIDLTLILIWPIIASLISISLKVNLIISVLIFYFIPSLLLSLRIKKEIKKAALFSFLSIPVYIALETLGTISNIWTINTIFQFKIFGSTIEGILWDFFAFYFAIMFYEYFLDKHITKKLYNPHLKYLLILVLSLFSVFLFTYLGFPYLLNINYAYLIIGIIFIFVPILLEIFTYNKLIKKFLFVSAYFFYFNFIYEITALKLSWWSFPVNGQFIGWISILGINFPFEELFFFILLGIAAALSFFEFFDDDNK